MTSLLWLVAILYALFKGYRIVAKYVGRSGGTKRRLAMLLSITIEELFLTLAWLLCCIFLFLPLRARLLANRLLTLSTAWVPRSILNRYRYDGE